ncbi:MAG TPA: efflux RND transporter periplasmic adaptor subunit, partial [Thermoanaerobaculia bacterium]|nr:efflux RND transporter periplasmic adaptor subunit [Thermoanaerobaculia bacterium]
HSEYAGELVGEVSDLAPKVTGLLREVRGRIGDRVERGAVVAVVDDSDLRRQLEEARGQLGVASANERRAQAELDGVESELRRGEDLHRQQVLSAQDYDLVVARAAQARATVGASRAQIEQAGARVRILEQQLAETRLLAPFTGTVAARYLDPGALVQPGTPILRLVEEGRLRVQFRVPERDLGAVRVGVGLSLTTQATGSTAFSGRVQRISGEVSRSDRTALVEGTPDSPADVLRPGMYAQVRVEVREITGATLVPGVAVLRRVGADGIERTGVFVVGDAGTAEWRDVGVLGASGNAIAVEGDLAVGDTVLTLGHEELRPGSPVQVMQWDGEGAAAGGGAP